MVIDFLPRLAARKYADSVVSLPLASLSQGGPKARESSPFFGRSILMTSAPRSARFWPVHGAASTRERSSTLICDKGPAMLTPQFPNRQGREARQEKQEHENDVSRLYRSDTFFERAAPIRVVITRHSWRS